MGNQHSASHTAKPRKNVHWKSAGSPGAPGKPEIVPVPSEEESNAVTLRWDASRHDGGAPLLGYQVECCRVGAPGWLRTAPPRVLRPELVLTGLEPPHRYQFRVAAVNAVGLSEYSELSDVLYVGTDPHAHHPPIFLKHVEDITALENDKTEFQVQFDGSPPPTIAWFKDGYEIFSSRRTAITTTDTSSVLVFHQTLPSDEGEIKCTATNRVGHAVSKAKLSLEAAPKLRYPRQYEDGLLYEINETIFLKISIVGKPTPTVEWFHDGQPLVIDERVEVTNTGKLSMLKIATARRSDRGEYQVHTRNNIGEDTAAFLVTVTAPPDSPRRLALTRQLDKSLTLEWDPPEDDGGCRIGNYVVEYYRTGWNVWLKATTSRKTSVTLFDLIEGSEYKFRVKAESPYGMSVPSAESATVRIPGRAVDMEFLAIESKIIAEALVKEDGQEMHVSPAPRRRRTASSTSSVPAAQPAPHAAIALSVDHKTKNDEFMLVLYPNALESSDDKTEKRKSFQLDLEDAISPPPLSLSAPELSSRCTFPFKALRNACSSTELLHERAMARFYKAVAMKEEYDANKQKEQLRHNDIPHYSNSYDDERENTIVVKQSISSYKAPEIIIKSDSVGEKQYLRNPRQLSKDSEVSETSDNKWSVSFDEDYTASTVTTDEEYSEDGSLDGDERLYGHEDETYNPRNKPMRPSPVKETLEEEEEEAKEETIKPIPLPDPNFVPKPILKKRETNSKELPIQTGIEKSKLEEKLTSADKSILENTKGEDKPRKEEKMTIFKKITKMPKQRIGFPKILNKKQPAKPPEKEKKENPKTSNKDDTVIEKIEDEGRTVIDYYSNIVKEFGGQKKPVTPLYLNTEELKSVAEKQLQEKAKKTKIVTKTKKSPNAKAPTSNNIIKQSVSKTKTMNSNTKQKNPKVEKQPSVENPKPNKKAIASAKSQENPDKRPEKCTQQIVLRTAERATIVIPIDYQELEDRAKENVRSVIDYMVDVCLLLLAFWVYFFKDERLAIPFLMLIIYRQFETLLLNIPEWIRSHTPEWLKKKTS